VMMMDPDRQDRIALLLCFAAVAVSLIVAFLVTMIPPGPAL
jgi:hypothetical protein